MKIDVTVHIHQVDEVEIKRSLAHLDGLIHAILDAVVTDKSKLPALTKSLKASAATIKSATDAAQS